VIFSPGQPVVRRVLHPDGRIATAHGGRVVADDDRGLLLWVGPGSAAVRRVDEHGAPTRHLPYVAELTATTLLQATTWGGSGDLILTPPGAGHSVWWRFTPDGGFGSWYVNLERPAQRWRGGIDVLDHALDIVVQPSRSWAWKDEDDFADRTGSPLFWDEPQARQIRAEGQRVAALAESARFPFDGTWCGFRPDPAWPPSRLPRWWDQPAVVPLDSPWDDDFFAG
jgi:hypothetical protein